MGLMRPKVTDDKLETQKTMNGSIVPNKKDSLKRNNLPSKSNQTWLKVLNPSFKSRSNVFKTIFGDSIDEGFIVDYSVALLKDMIIHGRLYLSSNYLCFYASILKWETSLVIKLKDIAYINKAKIIKVIPNAIQIVTIKGEKFVFTSFMARDKAFSTIVSLWHKARASDVVESGLSPPTTGGDPSIRKCYSNLESGSELTEKLSKDESSGEDDQKNLPGLVKKCYSTGDLMECQVNGIVTSGSDDDKSQDDNHDEKTPSESSVSGNELMDQCPYQGKGWLISDLKLPISADRLFELLFTDSQFMRTFMDDRKSRIDIDQDWGCPNRDDKVSATGYAKEDFVAMRRLTRHLELDYSFAKKITARETWYLEEFRPNLRYNIRTVVNSSGVPLCSSFYGINGYCLHRGSTDNETVFHIHYDIVFKSRLWGIKSFVEESAIRGCRDFCSDWVEAIKSWTHSNPKACSIEGLPEQLKTLVPKPQSIKKPQSLAQSNESRTSESTRKISGQSETILTSLPEPVNKTLSNNFELQSSQCESSLTDKSLTNNEVSGQRCLCPGHHDSGNLVDHHRETVKFLKPLIVFLLLLTFCNLFLLVRLWRLNVPVLSESSSPNLRLNCDGSFESSLSNFAYPSLDCNVKSV